MFGTIVSASDRGFWFAEADETHQSIFVHQKNVVGRRFLHLGERIRFDLAPSKIKPGEPEAVNVDVIPMNIARQTSDRLVRP